MTSTFTDRIAGLFSGAAIKTPCLVATTANITLNGEQTIDGVACVANNRVLVKNQSDTTANGIYLVSTSGWTRDVDFDGNRDIVNGTIVYITSGNTNSGYWRVSATDPIVIGTSAISFIHALVQDSSSITFLRSFLGALGRSIQSVLFGNVIDAKDSGTVEDGTTDDTTNLIKAINAAATDGKSVRITGSCRITARLDSLTSNPIRLIGRSNAFKAQAISETGHSRLICDGCAVVGAYVSATDTLTYTAQLQQLENLIVEAAHPYPSASAEPVGAVFDANICDPVWNCHFSGFKEHGIIDVGSVLCNIKASFYNCGEGRTTTGALNADTFIDGCAVLAVGSCTSGVAGNMASARTFSGANFGSSKYYDIVVENTAPTTTSFKGFIGFNQRSSILRFRGYNGVWLGYCEMQLASPHLEVYATGGAVAADGAPWCLVTLNSALTTSGPQFTATSPANPAGNARFLRTTVFDASHDFWGYDINLPFKRALSRAHLAELQLGDYKPDAGSYAITHVAGLGSVANPLLYYDSTLRSMRGTAGTFFVPAGLRLPLMVRSTVASGTNVDVDATVFAPSTDLGGGANAIYDVDVQIVEPATGHVFYHGSWVAMREAAAGNFSLRFYKLASVDNNPPAGGFSVTEKNAGGPGPYTLNIANATGFTYTYIVQGFLRAASALSAAY